MANKKTKKPVKPLYQSWAVLVHEPGVNGSKERFWLASPRRICRIEKRRLDKAGELAARIVRIIELKTKGTP
jgi:hypothetical protein